MNQLLESTIKELGFSDIESFAHYYAIEILEHKLSNYQLEIQKYKDKYGLDFEQFESKFLEISQFSIIEKEDDFIEWEGLLHSLKSLKIKIEQLRESKIPYKKEIPDFQKKIAEYFANVQ